MDFQLSLRRNSKILYLPPPTTPPLPPTGLILSSPSPLQPRPIEHAGFIYQQRLNSLNGFTPSSSPTSSRQKKPTPNEKLGGEKKKKKNGASADGVTSVHDLEKAMFKDPDDYYSLLELGHKRWRANEAEIRKSFRRLSLKYHPDKIAHLVDADDDDDDDDDGSEVGVGGGKKEDADEYFKKIIKAHDVLSDRRKRAAYDSIDDVDDSLPAVEELKGEKGGKRFYEVMGECFELNSRWSISRRVPKLGGEEMEMEEVYKFYDFWYGFKTWRDFSFDLEYDVEQADSREERRWMERQNSKHVKARKVAEAARIRTLVDLAYNNDPRIAKAKAEEKAAKEAALEERRRKRDKAKREEEKAEEEKRRKREEAVQREKEEKAKAKREKEAKRKVLRKARQRLRGFAKEYHLISNEKVMLGIERVCLEGSADEIDLCSDYLEILRRDDEHLLREVDAVLAASLKAIDKLAEKNASTKQQQQQQQQAKEADDANGTKMDKKAASASARSDSEEWKQAELTALQKALVRFPAGTVDRWIKVAEQLEGRSAEEVRKVAHLMKSGGRKSTSTAAPSYSMNGATPLRNSQKKSTATSSVSSSPISTPQANGQASTSPKTAKSNGISTTKEAGRQLSGIKLESGPPNTMNFIKRQQMALESGLKKFPAKLGETRWAKIAEKVPGRSPEECRLRFLELAAYFKSKKAAK